MNKELTLFLLRDIRLDGFCL